MNNCVVKSVKDLKKGDFFRRNGHPDGPVWIRDEYDRVERKYLVYRFDDINHWSYMKGSTKVLTGFTW